MHHSALHSHFDTSIFMEHSITIRYSITVSIYCRIDMYCRSLITKEITTPSLILKEIDWFTIFNDHDINYNYSTFVQTILSSLDTYIPIQPREKIKQTPLGGQKKLTRAMLTSQHFLPDGKPLKLLLTTWHMPSSATSLRLQHDVHNATKKKI